MAINYFYEKRERVAKGYNLVITPRGSWSGSMTGHTRYEFDDNTGKFTLCGGLKTITAGQFPQEQVFTGTSDKVTAYSSYSAKVDEYTSEGGGYEVGAIIDTVVGDRTAKPWRYIGPEGGEYDGYWYIRQGLAETVTPVTPPSGETVNEEYQITFTPSSSLLPTEISLSVDNGANWKVLSTVNAGVTSYTYDFSNETESTQCLIRFRAHDSEFRNYGVYAQTGMFTTQHNTAPLAPSDLSPASLTIDKTIVQRFSWKHNDTDAQSKFELQWTSDGATWNAITRNTSSQYVDISANVFPAGQITWKVRTYDTYGEVSPWSEQAVFTAGEPSDAPEITAPTSPVPVARPQIQWTQPDQIGFQVQIYDAVQQLAWDSGEIVSINRQVICGVDLLNGATYTIKLRTKNAEGLWSDWGSRKTTVSYTPPAKPTVQLTPDNNRCSVVFTIEHPAPAGNIEDNSGYVKYTGSWEQRAHGPVSGETFHRTETPGASASLTFHGTGVSLISAKADGWGIADIYIDGAKVESVDCYDTAALWQQTIFSVTDLADGVHTIKVVCSGEKNAASVGYRIGIDAFVVEGLRPAVAYVDILRSERYANNYIRIATSDVQIPGVYYLSRYYAYTEPDFTDYTVKPGQVYEYCVRAVGENGTSVLSDVVQAVATIKYAQISLLSDPKQVIDLEVFPEIGQSLDAHGKLLYFAGREKPVMQFEEFEDAGLNLSGTLYRSGDLQILKNIVRAKGAVLYRDCRNRKVIGTIPTMMASDDMIDDNWYNVLLTIDEVDYDEVV
ncbi:MAG TPA: hypothetical protein GXX72_01310 [Clostridiaceae bacterium]|nr:hypothetical protein [Clostridiaceae bacterium]